MQCIRVGQMKVEKLKEKKREKQQLRKPYQQLRKKRWCLICIQLSVHKFCASSFVIVRFLKVYEKSAYCCKAVHGKSNRKGAPLVAQQVFCFFAQKLGSVCQDWRSACLLINPFVWVAQRTKQLEAGRLRGAGRPVFDHHSLPNYLHALAPCPSSPL